MPGWELHRALSERASELAARMVFMTGGAMHESARRFLETVENPRFEKPFDVAQVRALVEDTLTPQRGCPFGSRRRRMFHAPSSLR